MLFDLTDITINNAQIVELVCIRNCTFLGQNTLRFSTRLREAEFKIYFIILWAKSERETEKEKEIKKGRKRKKKRERKMRKGTVLISKFLLSVWWVV